MLDYDIKDLGYDDHLDRSNLVDLDLMSNYSSDFDDSSQSLSFSGGIADLTDGIVAAQTIQSGGITSSISQASGVLFSGKTSFSDTTNGYRMGIDESDKEFKFIMGTSGSQIDWNVTTADTLTVSGAFAAGSLDIGGADATSFHVDTNGNMWLGAALYANGVFRVSNAGVAVITSATIGGWTVDSTKLSSASAFIDSSIPSIGLGTVTDYLTGTGFWVGLNGGAYKQHLGNPASDHMKWDGTNLTVTGTIIATTATIASTTTDTFTINSDLTDSNVDLVFGRTTGGNATVRWAGTNLSMDKTLTPITSDGAALGTGLLMWSDLYLASGSVVNWNNGDITLTHAANTLTFAGATSGYIFNDGSIGSSGNLTIAPTGDIIFDPTGNDILPNTGYDLNIGSLSKKYLTLHAAELWVETLVAQNTIATIGGRILVGPTTTLTRDLTAVATTIYVKHNEMASGDRAYMEANGSVEFFAITSAATLEAEGDYSYTVTRNLDGTGANAWSAGDAMFNTGTTGDGFIDIYSVAGVKAGTEVGPTIVGNVRNSATYNDWTSHWAIGNLNGLYGYGVTTYGVALGEYAASRTHVTLDSTNGLRFFNGTATVIGQWDTTGNITVGQVAASQSNVYITAGALNLRNNTTNKITLAADGTAFFSGAVTIGDGTATSGTLTLNHFNTGGDTYIAGGTINAAAWTANPGFILGIDDSDSDKVKFYLGDTTSHLDYNVTTANTMTLVGALTATSGSIAAFTLATTTISATNLVLTSGAANTANISVGTGSNLAGMNSGNSGTDIAIWAGDTFANRATADFRVNLQGDVVATSIIAPVTFVATDTLLKSADTERNTSTDTDYVLKKEISITNGGGTFRIKFDIHGTGAPAPRGAYAKIYRNGVAVGTERVDSTGVYQTFSEDISGWKTGDLIQLYLKTYQNGDNAFCRNFRIYGDVYYFTVNTD